MLDPAGGQGHAGGQPGRPRADHHAVDHRRLALLIDLRGAQRGPQRPPERLRLLGHEVAGVLDHLQRPAVAGAGLLGDLQPHHPVLAPPDERGRDGDPRQLLGRDRLGPELPQHPAVGGPDARGAGAVQGVGLGRLPALAHHRPDPVGVHRHLPEETPLGALARPGDEPEQGQQDARGGAEPARLPAPTSTSRRHPVRVGDREPGGDGGPERGARPAPAAPGRSAGSSASSQASTRAASGGPSGISRGAQARQVGRDHAMGRSQVADDRQPHPRPSALAVQQHHRRAVAALQHGRRHPGQVQPLAR